MNKQTLHMLDRVQARGISLDDALALRRISMTLQRWYELECGDGNDYCSWGIERDETTDKPYMVMYPHTGKSYRTAIADREKGALRRLYRIMARYPELAAYVQTDPRGVSLYIYRKDDPMLQGSTVDCCYSSIGTVIYK